MKKMFSAFAKKNGIFPVYKMIDTCASEFDSYVPYFYSSYEEENESIVSDKKKIIVLGPVLSESVRALNSIIQRFMPFGLSATRAMRPLS